MRATSQIPSIPSRPVPGSSATRRSFERERGRTSVAIGGGEQRIGPLVLVAQPLVKHDVPELVRDEHEHILIEGGRIVLEQHRVRNDIRPAGVQLRAIETTLTPYVSHKRDARRPSRSTGGTPLIAPAPIPPFRPVKWVSRNGVVI